MKVKDLSKYVNSYGFYSEIQELGLPFYNSKTWQNVDDLKEDLHLASMTTLKRLKVKGIKETLEVKGFYRVFNGYTPLYDVPKEYLEKALDKYKDCIYVFYKAKQK